MSEKMRIVLTNFESCILSVLKYRIFHWRLRCFVSVLYWRAKVSITVTFFYKRLGSSKSCCMV